jgi:DNA-binding MarR family transcriptional regulator
MRAVEIAKSSKSKLTKHKFREVLFNQVIAGLVTVRENPNTRKTEYHITDSGLKLLADLKK